MIIKSPMEPNGPAMPGHSATILRPGQTLKGPELPMPRWYTEWLRNQGKWVLLKCGCVQDINLPSAVSILTNKPEILCDKHDDFFPIARAIKFREVIEKRLGIVIPPMPDEPLF